MGSRSGWMRIAAALASGLMVAALFPPFHLSFLVWVAMLPLLAALWSLTGKRAAWKGFGIGFLAGAVSCLIQFNWLATVSSLGAVLLPLYLAIYWGIFGAFAAKFGNPWAPGRNSSPLITAFSHGAMWAGLELLRGWLFTGFGWNVLGVAFHETPVMAQGADLFGVAGLSLAVVFFQAAILQSLRSRKWLGAGVAAGLVGLLAIYGVVRIQMEGKGESIRLKTLLVQLNIPQEAARMLWTDVETHQGYEDETAKALETAAAPPDWVMWPETALTGRILKTDDGSWGTWQINQDTLEQVRRVGSFQLIYGVNELEAELSGDQLVPKEDGNAYNSIAVMNPDDDLQTYRKKHLVIFGETIPFVDSIPLLKKIYEQQAGVEYGGSFTPGESLEPLPIPAGDTVIGAIPTVCFEDSVPRLTRKFVRPGPQVIINVTNDGWFKESQAAAQHFANSRFRAIELRRPMLRCANTGVSAAVDSTGSAAHPDTGAPQILTDVQGSHFTRGSLLTELEIPLQPSFSLYAAVGDWGLMALVAFGIGMQRWLGGVRS